ncbi:hypothetical protein KQS06HV_50497 [Klebsiella quasipneumoniae subsp. similipneumoniae]|nr:hypothetical protein KQS06HV_50497 [Klebsiella quasipneumoniae subsp. similipneumoniae]
MTPAVAVILVFYQLFERVDFS